MPNPEKIFYITIAIFFLITFLVGIAIGIKLDKLYNSNKFNTCVRQYHEYHPDWSKRELRSFCIE